MALKMSMFLLQTYREKVDILVYSLYCLYKNKDTLVLSQKINTDY